ncbi:MAG: hypothetical protein ACTHNS_05780 [Marmoricola sp.]
MSTTPQHRHRTPRLHTYAVRGAAVTGAAALASVLVGGPALAQAAAHQGTADGPVKVVNTETVQVYMTPQGTIDSKRVYEQLAMSGHGRVDVTNPVSTKGLRNLDGFSGLTVHDGRQIVHTDVDGTVKTRSVSDFTGTLPLDVRAAYYLDGKRVQPGDVVGRSGHLEVRFTVTNTTTRPQQVSFSDGAGHTLTKTVQVPLPMVGSLTTTTPASFTNVASKQANMGGDGQGGTSLSFTMTLFPPIGSTSATFGYTADITDGVVPRVEVSALPVDPLASPTFASAAHSYQGGADTGAQLVDGAAKIDSNLLKLRDGAATLVAGLLKLNAGADQLHTGLATSAAPGAKKLATGAGQLHDGLSDLAAGSYRLRTGLGTLAQGTQALDTGAQALHAGAAQVAGGAGDAYAGGRKLTAGLQQISGGLGQLSAQLPGASDGIAQLKGGIDQLSAGLGTTADPTTLIGGLAALAGGLDQLHTGAGQISGGLAVLAHGDGTAANPGLDGAKVGVDTVKSGLDAAISDTTIAQLLTKVLTACGAACVTTDASNLQAALLAGHQGLVDASTGLAQVSGGLGLAITGIDTQLKPGADQIVGGLTTAQGGVGKLSAGASAAKGGVGKLGAVLDQLAEGITKAVMGVGALSAGSVDALHGSSTLTDGLGRLSAGAGQVSAGSGELAAGIDRADAGAGKLSAGSGELADGATQARDGSAKVATGAGQLSDGLGTAASGSGQLADGLAQAAKQAPQLPAGAQQLSDQGTRKLVAAGKSTTSTYGEMVAVMNAGAHRAQTADMAYGAPSDAIGLTAYSYVLQGDDGEGGRNLTRTAGGAAMLALAGGVWVLRRRFTL